MRGNIRQLQNKDLHGSAEQASTGVVDFSGAVDGTADQSNEVDAM